VCIIDGACEDKKRGKNFLRLINDNLLYADEVIMWQTETYIDKKNEFLLEILFIETRLVYEYDVWYNVWYNEYRDVYLKICFERTANGRERYLDCALTNSVAVNCFVLNTFKLLLLLFVSRLHTPYFDDQNTSEMRFIRERKYRLDGHVRRDQFITRDRRDLKFDTMQKRFDSLWMCVKT